MQTLLIVLHVILAVMLVALILLQGGSDELKGLGSSSGTDSIMTPAASAGFLTKLTATLAALFIINCLVLANLSSRDSRKSIADKIVKEQKVAEKPVESGVPVAD